VRSQQKAAAARASGRFALEITPIEVVQRKGEPRRIDTDEFIRPDTTAEILGKLKPAFRTDGKGSVTAGNSSGLNDGAAALLIASERGVKELGAKRYTHRCHSRSRSGAALHGDSVRCRRRGAHWNARGSRSTTST